ncbi:MAG: hypothetical protein KDB18_05555 [Salinibacterium sp.]|nr:hypothetical protein [Salinibacterium sp.]
MSTSTSTTTLYDDDADDLLSYSESTQRVTLMPSDRPRLEAGRRIRVLWGQDMLMDVLDGKYRAVICAVNDEDNAHGIISQIVQLITTSQWSAASITSYAKVFQDSLALHASEDREPFVLKYDLDSLLLLALLRPKGRDHFTVSDLGRGFRTVTKMLSGRPDRRPVATVSFLDGVSNRLIDADGSQPSFETVLRTMFDSGYRGDVYPSPSMWNHGHVGVFPTYPFPEGLDRMRQGSS